MLHKILKRKEWPWQLALHSRKSLPSQNNETNIKREKPTNSLEINRIWAAAALIYKQQVSPEVLYCFSKYSKINAEKW